MLFFSWRVYYLLFYSRNSAGQAWSLITLEMWSQAFELRPALMRHTLQGLLAPPSVASLGFFDFAGLNISPEMRARERVRVHLMASWPGKRSQFRFFFWSEIGDPSKVSIVMMFTSDRLWPLLDEEVSCKTRRWVIRTDDERDARAHTQTHTCTHATPMATRCVTD